MDGSCLAGLNPQQLQAATVRDGYELILAGAGTGKTHTLMSRVGYLMATGVLPEHILLLTFTNKAAAEMKERLVTELGPDAERVTAMTFHSFALHMLRDYKKICDLPEYRVLSTSDDRAVLKYVRSITPLGLSKDQLKEFPSDSNLSKFLSEVVNKELDLDMALAEKAFEEELYEVYQSEIKLLLSNYIEEKRKNHYLNFDDMLCTMVELLETNPTFRDRLSRQFTYIMCDEYQDTNVLQEHMLRVLSEPNKNLCVVGDDNQSIYKFRAAEIQNILTFEDRYPGCQTIALTDNYRSTQDILNVSNEMMELAPEGIKKWLVGQCHGTQPLHIWGRDERQTASWILDAVMQRYGEGVPLSQQAVLMRDNGMSKLLEQLCIDKHIPYRKFGGTKFLERETVGVLLHYLRLSLNIYDAVAWRSVLIQYPTIGSAKVEQILSLIVEHGVDALGHMNQYMPKSMRIQTALSGFVAMYPRLLDAPTVADKFYVIGVHYKDLLTEKLARTKGETEQKKLEKKLRELPDEIQQLQELAKDMRSVRAFFDDVVLDKFEEDDDKTDKLVISTIHSAKGLEWDTVYLLNPVCNVFEDRCKSLDEVAEARRVMYVALTRAKRQLYMIQSETMRLYDKTVSTVLSRFLTDRAVLNTYQSRRI